GFISTSLPDEVRYLIYPNESGDSEPLVADQEVFPGESRLEGTIPAPVTFDEAVAWLWRAGKVPQWINIQVEWADDTFTHVALRCCGRFTAREDLLCHQSWGSPALSGDEPGAAAGVAQCRGAWKVRSPAGAEP